MKKTLFTVAALGLAAGIATSASALELKVKGDYTVDGFYIDNGAGAATKDEKGGKGVQLASDYTNPLTKDLATNPDAWLQHMFNIEAEMVVNDKISMKSRVRLIDWGTVWGSQDDTLTTDGKNFAIDRLWMIYKSPVGVWEIGRRSAGAWGLPQGFLDKAGAGDRIYWNSGKLFGEGFTMYAFYEKLVEGEAYTDRGSFNLVDDDLDSDYYEICATLKGAWGNANLAYGINFNNATNADVLASTTYAVDPKTGLIVPTTTAAVPGFEMVVNRFKGYGQFKFGGGMGLDAEFDYKWGEKDFVHNTATVRDQDVSQLAALVDFNATISGLTGHAIYFYTSGDDNAKDTDLESYGGSGADYEPLYILTGVFGNILNTDQGTTNPFGAAAKTAGVNAFVLTGDFAASKDLTLHAGVGYAMADKELPGWDDSYGMEYNVGAAYKLLDNLIYAVHLGYLDTGDFFKMGTLYKDTNSIFLASHHLTMSF